MGVEVFRTLVQLLVGRVARRRQVLDRVDDEVVLHRQKEVVDVVSLVVLFWHESLVIEHHVLNMVVSASDGLVLHDVRGVLRSTARNEHDQYS